MNHLHRYSLTEPMLLKLQEYLEEEFGKEHPKTVAVTQKLEDTYVLWGDYDKEYRRDEWIKMCHSRM